MFLTINRLQHSDIDHRFKTWIKEPWIQNFSHHVIIELGCICWWGTFHTRNSLNPKTLMIRRNGIWQLKKCGMKWSCEEWCVPSKPSHVKYLRSMDDYWGIKYILTTRKMGGEEWPWPPSDLGDFYSTFLCCTPQRLITIYLFQRKIWYSRTSYIIAANTVAGYRGSKTIRSNW